VFGGRTVWEVNLDTLEVPNSSSWHVVSAWCTLGALYGSATMSLIVNSDQFPYLSPGALAVFGGRTVWEVNLDTLEVLNGSSWHMEYLQGARSEHAMVQMPCLSLSILISSFICH
jgi:hypothetical protein